MQLSSLLGLRVIDASSQRLGTVIDVRLTVAGDLSDSPRPPGARTGDQPAQQGLVSRLRAHRHQRPENDCRTAALGTSGTFLAAWGDIARVSTDHVTLRPGYTRYSAALQDPPAAHGRRS